MIELASKENWSICQHSRCQLLHDVHLHHCSVHQPAHWSRTLSHIHTHSCQRTTAALSPPIHICPPSLPPCHIDAMRQSPHPWTFDSFDRSDDRHDPCDGRTLDWDEQYLLRSHPQATPSDDLVGVSKDNSASASFQWTEECTDLEDYRCPIENQERLDPLGSLD